MLNASVHATGAAAARQQQRVRTRLGRCLARKAGGLAYKIRFYSRAFLFMPVASLNAAGAAAALLPQPLTVTHLAMKMSVKCTGNAGDTLCLVPAGSRWERSIRQQHAGERFNQRQRRRAWQQQSDECQGVDPELAQPAEMKAVLPQQLQQPEQRPMLRRLLTMAI